MFLDLYSNNKGVTEVILGEMLPRIFKDFMFCHITPNNQINVYTLKIDFSHKITIIRNHYYSF